MNKNSIVFTTEVEKFFFSPILNIGYGVHNGDYLNLYVFIGKESSETTSYPTPEIIEMSAANYKQVLKNLIALKKANLNDISAVIERVDWKNNQFYYAYSQNINFGKKDQFGKLLKYFYVRNSFDQVFKCLWNGVTKEDSYEISAVANNSTHYTMTHDGGTFDVGSLVTVYNANPIDFNGTYRVVGSSLGELNITCSDKQSYSLATTKTLTQGRVKYATLSTQEPVLGTGNFDSDVIITTSDGYKWKYMYTIDKGAKLKFMDNDWIPVPIRNITKYPYSANVGWGGIDTINVVDGGQLYTDGTNTVNIIISGDGTGASAEAFVSNNKVQTITVLNKGKDYTFANVYSTPAPGYAGTGAEIDFSISPIGGHKFDLLQEMYCSDIMVSVSLDRTEDGQLPSEFSFNQVGLLYNPYTYADTENHSNTSFISCTTKLLTTSLGGYYIEGEPVYQGSSLGNSTFKANVLFFDNANNHLFLVNTTGTPQESFELIGDQSKTSKIIQQIYNTNYIQNSGSIFSVENRIDSRRDPLGTEQIRILINYS